jgi:dienelactone hydrolase
MRERWIDYKDADQSLKGYWVEPDTQRRRPTVVVVHAFRGLTASIQGRAARLAAAGYAAFALDVFGPGVRPADHDTALATIKPFQQDREMFRQRLASGFEVARAQEGCDPDRMAAIGYCFGGMAVLEMARAGLPLAGVVSLHGELETPLRAQPGAIRAKILALHGDADVIVKQEVVHAFQDELREAGADWEFTTYSGAKHSFTGEGMGADSDPTAEFCAQAETRSWERQMLFLAEVIGS